MKIVVLIAFGLLVLLSMAGVGSDKGVGEFTQMEGMNNFALLIGSDATAEELEAAVQDKCGSETYCSVMGWQNAALVATKVPLSDEQLAGMTVHHSQNLSTGFRRTLFNCDVFPRDVRAECL